jgi:hypothetical protein
MSERQEKRDAERYEQAKEYLRAHIQSAVAGIDDAQSARAHAKEVIEAYQGQEELKLEQATRRFTLLQRIEFIVGAVVLVQIAIFVLKGEPYLVPLIISTPLCLALYVVVAVLDSKAKSKKQELRSRVQATKKVKLKTGASGKGVAVEFK